MAAAINFSGRGGSDFADAVVQVGAADSVGPLPARPFTGEKVMEISKR